MLVPAIAISVTGVLGVLIAIAAIVLLVLGVKWLFGLAGWSLPSHIWMLIGVIVILTFLLWIFTGGPVVVTR